MNDRFNFRAFHKKGYMFEVSKIDFSNGKVLGLNHIRYDIIEDVTLMQCTGLKDKNDVLIYEGDIVKYKDYFMAVNYTKIVEWDNDLDWGVRGYCLPDNCEVIGNIYEHSHLLEGVK